MTAAWNEVVDLLALAAAYDQRKADELDVKAWLMAADVGRWHPAAAQRVIVEHYASGADRPRITPAGITDGIRAARRAAAASFVAPRIPDELPAGDYPGWYRRQLADHCDALIERWAAGADMPTVAAIEAGPGRLAIGAAPAHLQGQIAADLARIGSVGRARRRPATSPAGRALRRVAAAMDPRRRAEALAELDTRRPIADPDSTTRSA